MTIGSNTSGHLFDTSLNADGVLYATSAGVIASTAVGTAGNVLTSNGSGVAPTFQAASAGVTGPGSSTNNGIATWNGTGGTALFSPATPLVDSTGRMTNSNQPCFKAVLTSSATNATGDGTIYQIAFNTTSFDNGSNFTTGASAHFTAPVAGKYLFTAEILVQPPTIAAADVLLTIITTSGTDPLYRVSASLVSGNNYSYNVTSIESMSANDTAYVSIQIGGGAKTTTVFGTTQNYTYFCGYLVC